MMRRQRIKDENGKQLFYAVYHKQYDAALQLLRSDEAAAWVGYRDEEHGYSALSAALAYDAPLVQQQRLLSLATTVTPGACAAGDTRLSWATCTVDVCPADVRSWLHTS
jgi:hypothetical protein